MRMVEMMRENTAHLWEVSRANAQKLKSACLEERIGLSEIWLCAFVYFKSVHSLRGS